MAPRSGPCARLHAAGQGEERAFPRLRSFWLFQGLETALFAGLGVALIGFAAWWVHERIT